MDGDSKKIDLTSMMALNKEIWNVHLMKARC